MNSIQAMAADIRSQLQVLPALELPQPVDGDLAFVGSGDSYVAGLAARYLSSGRATCFHPVDITSDPAIAKDRRLFFVSMSGKTRANIQAAKVASRAGAKTTAITTSFASPLSKECDSAFELKVKSVGKTAGTVGFTASLLACMHIVTNGRIACPSNITTIYSKADMYSGKFGRFNPESLVVLGDAQLYPAAMYCALKFNEVFGTKAMPYPVEDFCHAPLFGLKRNDKVIIFGAKDTDAQLYKRLKDTGFGVRYVDCAMPNTVESLFYAVFFVQHLVLSMAKRQKLQDCHFLQNKQLLKISSDFIYG